MKNISKKNAFREKIRRNYIDTLFEEKRKMVNLRAEQLCGDGVQVLQGKKEEIGGEERMKEEFRKQISGLLDRLPHSIQKIVEIANNYPQIFRLILSQNLQKLTSTFPQTNLIQWSNYIYLIQSLLVFQPEHCPQRIFLIQKTSGPILYRVNKLCEDNRLFKISILRNYYDYLVAVGSDIIFLDSIDLTLIIDNLKKVLQQICNPNDFKQEMGANSETQDLINSVVLLCNTIVSLSPISIKSTQNQQTQKQYECEHIKIIFLSELSKHPVIMKNLSMFAIASEPAICEQVMRFFINYTFLLSDCGFLHKIKMHFFILIQCVLANNKASTYEMRMLVLRFINNIAVSGIEFCSDLVEESILSQMTRVFGAIYFEDSSSKGSNDERQYQISIQRQFVSTLASCVIMGHEDQRILNYLQHKCGTKKIIEETLRIAIDEPDLLIKCLQAILIYLNSESYFYSVQLKKHITIFQDIAHREGPQNIHGLAQQILNVLYQHHQQQNTEIM